MRQMSQMTMRAAAAAQEKRRRQRATIKCGEHTGQLVARWTSSVCEMRVYHFPTHDQPWWVTDDLPQVYRKCASREEAERAAQELLRSATLDILHQPECIQGI